MLPDELYKHLKWGIKGEVLLWFFHKYEQNDRTNTYYENPWIVYNCFTNAEVAWSLWQMK